MGLDEILAKIESDPFSRFLGIEFLEIREGYGRVAMTVAEHMLNFHGIPHGGAIFTLADVAFAVACNSHVERAVAIDVDIHFVAAVPVGTRLVAEAVEESLGRRIALYRMTVTTEEGTLVALCHGTAYRRRAEQPSR